MFQLLSSLFGGGGAAGGGSGMAPAGGGSGMATAGGSGGGIMGLIQSILSGGADWQKQAEQARMSAAPMGWAQPQAGGNFGGLSTDLPQGGIIPLVMQMGMGKQNRGEDIREAVLGDLYGSNVLNRR